MVVPQRVRAVVLAIALVTVISWTQVPSSSLSQDAEHANPSPSPESRGHSPAPGPEIVLFTQHGDGAAWNRTSTLFPAERLRLQLQNLPPGRTVTLEASWHGCLSHASFTVGESGKVDLSQQAPRDGTYTGIDPDGMLWSMACPHTPPPNGAKNEVLFTASQDGKTLASLAVARSQVPSGVRVIDVHENGLVGKLFLPPGNGPFPTVMVLGGSEGGLASPATDAAYLAGRGYATLALAYFKERGLPTELKNIPLEYFGKAIDWLQKRPEARPGQLAVWGESRGGELALLLGATYPQIKAVVANVPSGVVWGADADDESAAAWTLNGRPVSHLFPNRETSQHFAHTQVLPGGGRAVEYIDSYLDLLKNKENVARATIPVERIQGPVLMFASQDDKVWPSCALSQIAWDRLQAAHRRYHDAFYCLPRVGHWNVMPGMPTTFPYLYDPEDDTYAPIGGEPAGTAAAERQTTDRIDRFLDETFRS